VASGAAGVVGGVVCSAAASVTGSGDGTPAVFRRPPDTGGGIAPSTQPDTEGVRALDTGGDTSLSWGASASAAVMACGNKRTRSQTVYNTKSTRAHTQRELI